jgi:hypothetical protein
MYDPVLTCACPRTASSPQKLCFFLFARSLYISRCAIDITELISILWSVQNALVCRGLVAEAAKRSLLLRKCRQSLYLTVRKDFLTVMMYCFFWGFAREKVRPVIFGCSR